MHVPSIGVRVAQVVRTTLWELMEEAVVRLTDAIHTSYRVCALRYEAELRKQRLVIQRLKVERDEIAAERDQLATRVADVEARAAADAVAEARAAANAAAADDQVPHRAACRNGPPSPPTSPPNDAEQLATTGQESVDEEPWNSVALQTEHGVCVVLSPQQCSHLLTRLQLLVRHVASTIELRTSSGRGGAVRWQRRGVDGQARTLLAEPTRTLNGLGAYDTIVRLARHVNWWCVQQRRDHESSHGHSTAAAFNDIIRLIDTTSASALRRVDASIHAVHFLHGHELIPCLQGIMEHPLLLEVVDHRRTMLFDIRTSLKELTNWRSTLLLCYTEFHRVPPHPPKTTRLVSRMPNMDGPPSPPASPPGDDQLPGQDASSAPGLQASTPAVVDQSTSAVVDQSVEEPGCQRYVDQPVNSKRKDASGAETTAPAPKSSRSLQADDAGSSSQQAHAMPVEQSAEATTPLHISVPEPPPAALSVPEPLPVAAPPPDAAPPPNAAPPQAPPLPGTQPTSGIAIAWPALMAQVREDGRTLRDVPYDHNCLYHALLNAFLELPASHPAHIDARRYMQGEGTTSARSARLMMKGLVDHVETSPFLDEVWDQTEEVVSDNELSTLAGRVTENLFPEDDLKRGAKPTVENWARAMRATRSKPWGGSVICRLAVPLKYNVKLMVYSVAADGTLPMVEECVLPPLHASRGEAEWWDMPEPPTIAIACVREVHYLNAPIGSSGGGSGDAGGDGGGGDAADGGKSDHSGGGGSGAGRGGGGSEAGRGGGGSSGGTGSGGKAPVHKKSYGGRSRKVR